MIHLYEYLLNNLCNPIFEVNMRSWKHKHNDDDYYYPKAVITQILKDKKLGLGNQSIESEIDFENLTPDEENELRDIYKNVTADDAQERFNKFAEKYGFAWNKIFKGTFSGVTVRGSNGQIYESLVCHLFNVGNYTDKNIYEWCEKFTHGEQDESWVNSSKISVDKIHELINKKYSGNDYIALHVDGQNFDTSIDEKLVIIASVFQGTYKYKNSKCNIRGKISKDKWNPADIVLIKKDINTDEYFSSMDKVVKDKTALENQLMTYVGAGDILPISLKKVGSKESAGIYGHNIDKADLMDSHTAISDIKLKLGQKYVKDETSGNFVIIGITGPKDEGSEKLEIQVRAQTGNDNVSIEAKLPNNKLARGGKGITVIKNILNINNNDYYINFKDNDELLESIKKYKFVDDKDNVIDKLPKQIEDVDLYKRTCYRAFFGLLEKFKAYEKSKAVGTEKKNNENDILINFGQFIWNCCTDCPSSYYIVK